MYKPTVDTQKLVARFLRTQVKDGPKFFKSKHISKELGLSPKEVGCTISLLRTKPECKLNIEVWAGSRSFTWKVSKT